MTTHLNIALAAIVSSFVFTPAYAQFDLGKLKDAAKQMQAGAEGKGQPQPTPPSAAPQAAAQPAPVTADPNGSKTIPEQYRGVWSENCAKSLAGAKKSDGVEVPITIGTTEISGTETTCVVKSAVESNEILTVKLMCSGEGDEWESSTKYKVISGKFQMMPEKVWSKPMTRCGNSIGNTKGKWFYK